MSVEAAVIALLVEEGTPKKAFQAGVSADDFELYDEEFQWIEKRYTNKQSINPRIFRERFQDFEWIVPAEQLTDLLAELKQERAFTRLNAAIETVGADLEIDNAIEKAQELREYVTEIVRVHAPHSNIDLGQNWQDRMNRIKKLRALRANGEFAGIPSGLKHIDFNWGGFIDGRVTTVLGRSGEGKSLTIAYFIANAILAGYRIGFFSPEMNQHEHECRLHTLLSANETVQQKCGLTRSFRNRALMEGHNFPIKKYQRFLQFLDGIQGRCVLFTQQYRREKMSVSYIDAMIEDLKLDMVVIDPIYKLKPPRNRGGNKVWELGDLISDIEDMAKGHNIPVIITNQAHRQVGVNARRRAPSKDTSYMSDAMIHESDHVIGVRYDAEDHILRMRCSKSRFGGEFDIDVRCYPNIGMMKETTEPKGDWYNGGQPGTEDTPGDDLPEVRTGDEQKDEPKVG